MNVSQIVSEIGNVIINDLVEEKIPQLFQLRSIEKVYSLILTRVNFKDQEELPIKVKQSIHGVSAETWENNLKIWSNITKNSFKKIVYRVTVKIRGKNKIIDKTHFSQFVVQQLDETFKKEEIKFELESDTTNWAMEIFVHIRKQELWMGISLTPTALWKKRKYQSYDISYGKTSLKPSICYAMIKLLNVNSGCIIEPMVGSGMILMELIDMNLFSGICLCGDNANVAICKTNQNISAMNINNNFCIDLFHWDCCFLPFSDNSVDGILTDLPFGKRIATESSIVKDYPKFLDEFFRVLKKKCRLVLLTSHLILLNKILSKDRRWVKHNQLRINHGGIECAIFVLSKRYSINKSA